MISVQQQTPDNDFCHFNISNVRFAFWVFFSKTGKTRVSHRVKMMTRWPGDPDVKGDPNDPLTRWPNDPVPCLPRTGYRSIAAASARAAAAGSVMLRSEVRGSTQTCRPATDSRRGRLYVLLCFLFLFNLTISKFTRPIFAKFWE